VSSHPGPDRALIDECVHCGFCLPACPTYTLWGEEMDSPRGRIHLMAQHQEGAPLGPVMVGHLDRCLSCLACVTACPSGVQYEKLIEATRAEIEQDYRRPWRERALRGLIFGVFPYPRRLRVLRGPLRVYQRLGLGGVVARTGVLERAPASLRVAHEVLPPVGRPARLPVRSAARGPRRGTVGLLTGCVQGSFFPRVNEATVRVLRAEGWEVVVPRGQGCCGALSVHSGRVEEARRLARGVVDTFLASGVRTVVVNAAGCGSAMKDYAHLLREDPAYATAAAQLADRTADVAEFLDREGPRAPRGPVELTVAYHDACHLAHAQQVRDAPRRLLSAIPGLRLVELGDGLQCCGSAGVYNLLQPAAASELGERKAVAVRAAGPDLLVSANPGCLMQIGAALRRTGPVVPACHTVELLDASVNGTPLPR
jgi:glycolate oxidase iron-sulfur subunit